MPHRTTGWIGLAVVAALTAACGRAALQPADLDTRNEMCGFCNMVVSSRAFAAQVVAPGEEAKFFDDLGCLASWTKEHPLARDAAVFVGDHRTGEWVPAAAAVYSRVETIDTPMGSHLVAHANEASRAADKAAAAGTVLSAAEAIGLPAGRQ
jgi:copper chaperone NosL